VLAFEPYPPTFALLQANVTRNKAPNVELHPLAVGTQRSYSLRRTKQSAKVARMLRGWGFSVTVTPDRYNPALGYIYGRSSWL